MDSSSRGGGCLFAFAGGLFALCGAGLLIAQIFSGEIPFDVEGRQKPLGVEFAGVFFTFGQLFLFLGLGTKRHPLFLYLGLGNGALALGMFALLFLQAAVDLGWSLEWPALLVLWSGMVGVGIVLEFGLGSRADPLPDPSEPESPHDSAEEPFAGPRRFFGQITKKDWQRATAVGMLFGLLPIVFFGGIMLLKADFKDGGVILLAGFLLFFGFGVCVAMSIIVRWKNVSATARQEYEMFARQVKGQVVLTQAGGGLIPLPSLPREVSFPDDDRKARLQVVRPGAGDDHKTFTQLIFPLPEPADFSCRVSSLSGRTGDTFKVTANNDREGEILDRAVREELLQLRDWAEHASWEPVASPAVGLQIESDRLTVRMEGYLHRAETLTEFHNRAQRIERSARQALGW